MDEKIYMVFNYDSVEAVFKNKEKAEQYCKCHEDTVIEECSLDDSKTFTLFNVAIAEFDIDMDHLLDDDFGIAFSSKCIEEDGYYLKYNGTAHVYKNASIETWLGERRKYNYHIIGEFYKILPDSFSENIIEEEMYKTFQNLKNKFEKLLSKYRNDRGILIIDDTEIKKINKAINNII